MLLFIKNFDSNHILNKWDKNELLILTNQFNILYEIDIIGINEINQYYKNWETIFHNNSDEYIIKTKEAIKQSFENKNRYDEKNHIVMMNHY